MMDLASLSSGQQVALAIGVNIAALVMLWGPYAWFRWHYRNTKNISWRTRVGLFVVFAVLFVIFWWGYLVMSHLEINRVSGETMRDLFNSNFFIEVISFTSIPVYFYNLFSGYRSKGVHVLRIISISAGLLVSFSLYIWLVGYSGVRFFG